MLSLVMALAVLANGQEPEPAFTGSMAAVSVTVDKCGYVHFRVEANQSSLPVTAFWNVDYNNTFHSMDTIIRFVNPGKYPYELTLTDGIDMFKFPITFFTTEYKKNMVFASHEVTDCSVANFKFDYTNQNNPPLSIDWSGDDLFASNEFQPIHNYSHPGRFKYNCTMISAYNCDTSIYEGVLNIVNTANADAGINVAICIDAPVFKLHGLPAGGTWSGKGLDNGTFSSTRAGVGKHCLTYRYQQNGCPAKDEMQVEVRNITADFDQDITEGFAPLTVSFTDKSIGTISSRTWNFGDQASDGLNTSDAENPFHTFTEQGIYHVWLETRDDETGCYRTASRPQLIRVKKETIVTKHFEHKLNFAPNPSTSGFTLEIDLKQNETYSLQVIDELGHIVSAYKQLSAPKLCLLDANAPSAVYFVRVQSNDGSEYTGRFVVLR